MKTLENRPTPDDYSGNWILHPRSFSAHETAGKQVYILAEASDPAANYSYDDYALVFCPELKTFYILNTSGCSCPNDTETGVEVARTDNCTSWRELQKFIAEHLGFVFFEQIVADLKENMLEINEVCFGDTYMGYHY